MPEFFLESVGFKKVITKFERMGMAAYDASPAFEKILELIFYIEDKTFDGQGRRGGGSWRFLTDEWLSRKIRNGLDPRINHATQALRDSMTVRDADHQEVEIRPTHLRLISTLPYAKTAQRNRPFVKFLPQDVVEMRHILRNHLMSAWRPHA